jgi:membrane fusion protein
VTQNNELFRSEAIDGFKDRKVGSAIWSPTRSPLPSALLVTSGVVLALTLLAKSSYSEKYTVTGRLLYDGGLTVVSAGMLGTVTSLHVSEGSLVRSGQKLFEVSNERYSAGGKVGEKTEAVLNREISRRKLDAERVFLTASLEAAKLSQEMLLAQGDIRSVERQIGIEADRVTLNSEWLTKLQALEIEGFISKGYTRTAQLELYQSKARIEELKRTLASLKNRVKQNSISSKAIDVSRDDRQSQILSDLARLNSDSISLQSARSAEIVAPQDGQIAALYVRTGEEVKSETVALSLAPKSARLMAFASSSSKQLGLIEPGMKVSIRLTAFPFERFGQGSGIVEKIQLISPQTKPPNETDNLDFRIVIRLDGLPNGVTYQMLKIGTEFEADVIARQRSIYSWLFDPIKGSVARHR